MAHCLGHLLLAMLPGPIQSPLLAILVLLGVASATLEFERSEIACSNEARPRIAVPQMRGGKPLSLMQVRDRLHTLDAKAAAEGLLSDGFLPDSNLTDFERDFLMNDNNPLDMMDGQLGTAGLSANRPTAAPVDFDCRAGLANWRRGWSEEKKSWCCTVHGQGCIGKAGGGKGGKRGSVRGRSTNSSNSSSLGKQKKVKGGEHKKGKDAGYAAWNNASAWNLTESDSPGNKSLPVANASAKNETCVTRQDPRASYWGYTAADPGTPCVFGVDDRDEGSHCIMDDGKYGSYGWCWTTEAMDAFGSCGESCPLFGQARILGKAIKDLSKQLEEALQTSTSTTTTTTTTSPSSTTMAAMNAVTPTSNWTSPSSPQGSAGKSSTATASAAGPAGGNQSSNATAEASIGEQLGPNSSAESNATGQKQG